MKHIFHLIVLTFINTLCFSQTGSLNGIILNDKNKPIPHASIVIQETNTTIYSNMQGEYTIDNLSYGTYTIKVSASGLSEETLNININEPIIKMDFQLEQKNYKLNTVEVFGERSKKPEKLDVITRLPLKPKDLLQSISVISDRLIEEQGNLTITDATRNVVGVYSYSRYGNSSESISIRGFRGVPIYKNGVRLQTDPRGFGFISDVESIESIQVLKGASAVTMGAGTDLGSPGGLINVVTKTPKFTETGQVTVRAGGFNQFRTTFDIQSIISKDKTLAFRINGGYEDTQNFHRIKGVGINKFFINPSLEWRPDDKTAITLEFDYLKDSRTLDPGTVNLDNTNTTNQIFETKNFFGFISDRQFATNTNIALRFKRDLNDNLYIRGNYFTSTLNTNGTRTSLTALPKDIENNINVTQNTIYKRSIGSSGNRSDKNSIFQFDLVGQDLSTAGIKHTFMVGLDYTTQNNIQKTAATNAGSIVIDTINVFGNVTNTLPKGIKEAFDLNIINERTTNNIGITFQDVIQLTDWAKVYGSLRYTKVESTIPNSTGASHFTDSFWNPLVGFMVSATKNINIFSSYTNTTKTPFNYGTNPVDRDGNQLSNERIDQIEVGMKSEWFNDRLRFNVTGFKINNTNMNIQAAILNPATGFVELQNYYFKGGNDERKGIETEVSGRLTENVEIIVGHAYIDAQYKEHTTFVNGSSPNNTPKHTFNAWGSYFINKGVLSGLSLSAGIYYIDDRPYNDWTQSNTDFHGITPNLEPWKNKAYTIVNTQISYNINKNWNTRLFINNIFNAVGYDAYRNVYIDRIEPFNISMLVAYRF